MAAGADLYDLGMTRLGEKYINVLVPKDNPNWHGPWDCAEFASWVVYQITGKLYGCTDNRGNPATTESYSGAWVHDAQQGVIQTVNQPAANITAGIILIRKPPMPGHMGHIAITSGNGGTVEAAGVNLGVRKGRVEGRQWHFCAMIPDVQYESSGKVIKPKPVPFLMTVTNPPTTGDLVMKVQKALKERGFDPGVMDGTFGHHTGAAVFAFQKMNKLVADGVVGPSTAKKLGIEWP